MLTTFVGPLCTNQLQFSRSVVSDQTYLPACSCGWAKRWCNSNKSSWYSKLPSWPPSSCCSRRCSRERGSCTAPSDRTCISRLPWLSLSSSWGSCWSVSRRCLRNENGMMTWRNVTDDVSSGTNLGGDRERLELKEMIKTKRTVNLFDVVSSSSVTRCTLQLWPPRFHSERLKRRGFLPTRTCAILRADQRVQFLQWVAHCIGAGVHVRGTSGVLRRRAVSRTFLSSPHAPDYFPTWPDQAKGTRLQSAAKSLEVRKW